MKRATLAGCLLGAALPTLAADGLRPGQYDYMVNMEMPGMPFAMPAMTMQHCLTQADLDTGRQYQGQPNQDCEVKNLKQSPGKASMDLVCKDGTTGKGEFTFGNDALHGKTTMTKDGQAMAINMSARRKGDCKQ
jgi:hypothetical protein